MQPTKILPSSCFRLFVVSSGRRSKALDFFRPTFPGVIQSPSPSSSSDGSSYKGVSGSSNCSTGSSFASSRGNLSNSLDSLLTSSSSWVSIRGFSIVSIVGSFELVSVGISEVGLSSLGSLVTEL